LVAQNSMKRVIVKSGLLTLALFFNFFSKGYSIGDRTQIGAREVSLGNASVAMVSAFSVFHNQAALARMNNVFVAIDYRRPYLIDDLAEKALAIVVPATAANFGFSVQQKSIQSYSESCFGFSMAKILGKRISVGLQFDYILIGFPEQGSSLGTFFVEFGVLFHTSENVTFGLHIFNPGRASVESLNLKSDLPAGATSGIAFYPSANLLFVSAIAYRFNHPLMVSLGVEYQISDRFFLRGGLSAKPIRHSAGLGYKSQYFGIDFGIVHHETLGYTPSMSLVLNF